MNKRVKIIIKIIAILIVAAIIPAGGIFFYGQSDEAGEIPMNVWSSTDDLNLSDITTYNLNESGDFKILQLTDPQFGLILALSGKATSAISKLVNTTDPDLIIITGDVTSTPINGIIYKQFVKFMDLFGIPYAIVFGNHDAEGRASKEVLANILAGGENSIFKYGPSNITGIGNYVVNINKTNGDTAWSLFMFDSNQYDGEEYDYIHQDQIDWYTWNINKIKAQNNGALNSLAFFHIPLVEFSDAFDNKTAEDLYFGDKREEECTPKTNSGLFTVMKDLDSTRGVFVGHDHINDYSVNYQGIRLTYGLKCSENSYDQDGVRGGLLITLSEDSYTVEQVFQD